MNKVNKLLQTMELNEMIYLEDIADTYCYLADYIYKYEKNKRRNNSKTS